MAIHGKYQYRTLCHLPVELLCRIIFYVPDDVFSFRTIRACTLVCRCIRPVALVHHFGEELFLHGITSFNHALFFLQANPRICEKITRLKLQGEIRKTSRGHYSATTPIDDATVARILELLPKIEHLDLWFLIYAPPVARASPLALPIDHPRRLKSCHVQFGDWQTDARDSSVSGLFSIFSLFSSIRELCILNAASKFGTSPPLDPAACKRRPCWIRSISMRDRPARDLNSLGSTLKLVNALQASTEPGILETLKVRCASPEEVAAVGKLIAHARGALKFLDIGAEVPRLAAGRRPDWEDPFDGHWEKLHLVSCSKLYSIEVHIHFRPYSGDTDVQMRSLAAIGMFSQVSSAVREITIRLHGLPPVQTTLGLLRNGQLLGLAALDEAITPDQFQRLVSVHLCMHLGSTSRRVLNTDWKDIEDVVWSKTLPKLHEAGQLDFGIQSNREYRY